MAELPTADGAGLDVEALYRRERERIHAMCVAILRDQGDAEDAVQETFARVAARAGAGALHGDPTGYLVVVARNVCRDELRRRARRPSPGEAQRADPTPEDTAVQRGLLGFVWRHLARVEQTLLVDVFSGMSMAEIGERTGTSGDVAAQRVSRLRRRIRNMVAAPAALLWPALQGSAAGRALTSRLHLGALFGSVLDRVQSAEQVIGPVLVGIAAGAMALPPPAPSSPHVTPAALVAVRPSAAPTTTGPLGTVLGLPHAVGSALPSLRPLPSAAAAVIGNLPKVLPPPPDAGFVTFTPSPGFAHDHVVFAASFNCVHYPCTSLWRSDDAGSTWKALTTQSMPQSYSVELPPSWPADPTIFAVDFTEVDRSDDGGATFRRVFLSATSGHLPAVDPTSQPGKTRIFLDSGTAAAPLVYAAADDSVHPLSGLPTGTTGATVVAMLDQAYLDVTRPETPDTLYSCPATAAACSPVGPGAWTPTAVSPTFDVDHTYFNIGWDSLLVGTLSGGQSATTVQVPGMRVVGVYPASDYASSGVVDLAVQSDQSYNTPVTGIRLVRGAAQPWPVQMPDGTSLAGMTRLPDGRLFAPRPVVYTQQTNTWSGGGLYCSTDDGLTWATSC